MTDIPLEFHDQTENLGAKQSTVFDTLYGIDVRPFLFQKNKFDYLPWAVAIKLLMKHYPNAKWRNVTQPREINGENGLVKMQFPYFL